MKKGKNDNYNVPSRRRIATRFFASRLRKILSTSLLLAISIACSTASFSDGKLDGAAIAELKVWNVAITSKPNANNYGGRAAFYRKHKLFQEALRDDERAVRLAPLDAGSWASNGLDLCELSRFKEALSCLNRALSLSKYGDEVYVNSLRGRVWCFVSLGEKAKARADQKVLIELGAAPPSSLNDSDIN
jgi:tetratricopeptide (TPR) repeat protein